MNPALERALELARNVLVCLALGYVVTVIASLVVFRGISHKSEVYDAYCSMQPDITMGCACPDYEPRTNWGTKLDYGVMKKGFPLVDNYQTIYPCGAEASTEEKDFRLQNPKGAFYVNILIWALVMYSCGYLINKMRKNKYAHNRD